MYNHPIVSIITPVFNGEDYISETIESVLNAEIHFDYEYIVLDDGSTDATLEILQRYSEKIKIYSHSNIGESSTVNIGLDKSSGKFILVLNADDPLLTGELINESCQRLIQNPEIVAIYPDWKIIDKSGGTLKTIFVPDYSDKVMIGECRCLPGPGTLFRRDAAIKIQGRSNQWRYVGDYDFWLRLSRVGKIVRLPGVLSQWRESSNSLSISNRGFEMAVERITVISTFLGKHEVPKKIKRNAIASSFYLAARLAFFDSRINGRNLMIRSFLHSRGWPKIAKFHVVLYLLFLPLSKKLLDKFPKIVFRISRR
jgi:glycosyltransferase involved in cell wall biosynthesis